MGWLTQGFNPTYHEDAPTMAEVAALSGLALLEFGATWCGHCQRAEPLVEQTLSGKTLPHAKIFDGKGKRLGRAYKIKLWPTLILLRDGEEVARVVRPVSASELEQLLASG